MTSKSNAELMASRYGIKPDGASPQRIFFTILAAVLVIAFVTWAAWVAIAGSQTIKSQDLGYEILGPTQASVTYEVTSPNSQQVTCAIQVLNQGFQVVGYREISFAAQAGIPVKKQTFVNTTELGVTGVVDKCWVG